MKYSLIQTLPLVIVLVTISVPAQTTGVSFVDGQTPLSLELRRTPDDKTHYFAKVALALRNETGVTQTVTFLRELELYDKDGSAVKAKINLNLESIKLKGGEVKPVPLTIKVPAMGGVLSGYLHLEAKPEVSPNPSTAAGSQSQVTSVLRTRAVQLSPPRPADAANTNWAVWRAFVLALMSTAISLIIIMIRCGLNALRMRMGIPTWDFSQSWAANLTVIGGALTSLISFTGLPDQGYYMSKKAYMLLGILFTALLLLAPSLYNFLRKPIRVATPDPQNPLNQTGLRFEGYVWAFLVAAGMILWGVFGQLATLWLLFGELEKADYLSHSSQTLLRSTLIMLGLGLLVYASVSSEATVQRQKKVYDENESARLDSLNEESKTDPPLQEMPKWHVL